MPQRPVGVSRVARTQKPADIPAETRTGPGNTIPWTGRLGWLGRARQFENRLGAETAPAGGEPVPNPSAGELCSRCDAYAIDPDRHAERHAEQDRWVRGVNREIAAIQRILRTLGHVATDGETASTDGDTPA